MGKATHVFSLKHSKVLYFELLLLVAHDELFFFITDFLLADIDIRVNSLLGFSGFVAINRHFNNKFSAILLDLSGALYEHVFLLSWQVPLLILVVESKVVTFTLLCIFAFDVLFRNINPVAHATFHDALNKQKLFFCGPISVEELEIQIVQDNVLAYCFSGGSDSCLSAGHRGDGHTSSVALETNDEGLAGTTDCFVLNRPDLDTLADVVIAQATKLWADDIFEVDHFSSVKIRGLIINFLTSRIWFPGLVRSWRMKLFGR